MTTTFKNELVAALRNGRFVKTESDMKCIVTIDDVPEYSYCAMGGGAELHMIATGRNEWESLGHDTVETFDAPNLRGELFSPQEQSKIVAINDYDAYEEEELLDLGIPKEFVYKILNKNGFRRATTFEDMADFIENYL